MNTRLGQAFEPWQRLRHKLARQWARYCVLAVVSELLFFCCCASPRGMDSLAMLMLLIAALGAWGMWKINRQIASVERAMATRHAQAIIRPGN